MSFTFLLGCLTAHPNILSSKEGEVAKAKQLIVAEGRVPNIVTQIGLKGNEKLRLLPGLQYKFKKLTLIL